MKNFAKPRVLFCMLFALLVCYVCSHFSQSDKFRQMITRADVIAEIYFDNSAGLYSNCHNYHGWGGIETDYDVVAKPVQVIRGSVTGPFKFTVICKPLSRWYLRQNSCFPELTGHALVFLKYDNNGQLVNDTDFSPGIIFGPSDGGIFRIKDGQVWIFGVAGHPSDGGVFRIEDGQVWWPNYRMLTGIKRCKLEDVIDEVRSILKVQQQT